MNYELTSEQQMIRKLMRDFAEGEVAPGADERDRKASNFPRIFFRKMAKLNLMGLPFPEEYGERVPTTISFAIAVEELSPGLTLPRESLTLPISHWGVLPSISLEPKNRSKNIWFPLRGERPWAPSG